METSGSPLGQRFVSVVALVGLFFAVGGSSRSVAICHAQSGCNGLMPPPIPVTDPNYNKGFKADTEVPYFVDLSTSDEESRQIEVAFAAWQAGLATVGRNITFTKTLDQSLARSTGLDVVIGPTPRGEPANFKVIHLIAETHELKAAKITIDLRGGPMPGMLYFDPEKEGYDARGSTPGAITKAVMHEVGHALGVHHFAGRACSDQQSGASVMNGMCGINDGGAVINGVPRPPALASRPAPCDVAAVLAVSASVVRGSR